MRHLSLSLALLLAVVAAAAAAAAAAEAGGTPRDGSKAARVASASVSPSASAGGAGSGAVVPAGVPCVDMDNTWVSIGTGVVAAVLCFSLLQFACRPAASASATQGAASASSGAAERERERAAESDSRLSELVAAVNELRKQNGGDGLTMNKSLSASASVPDVSAIISAAVAAASETTAHQLSSMSQMNTSQHTDVLSKLEHLCQIKDKDAPKLKANNGTPEQEAPAAPRVAPSGAAAAELVKSLRASQKEVSDGMCTVLQEIQNATLALTARVSAQKRSPAAAVETSPDPSDVATDDATEPQPQPLALLRTGLLAKAERSAADRLDELRVELETQEQQHERKLAKLQQGQAKAEADVQRALDSSKLLNNRLLARFQAQHLVCAAMRSAAWAASGEHPREEVAGLVETDKEKDSAHQVDDTFAASTSSLSAPLLCLVRRERDVDLIPCKDPNAKRGGGEDEDDNATSEAEDEDAEDCVVEGEAIECSGLALKAHSSLLAKLLDRSSQNDGAHIQLRLPEGQTELLLMCQLLHVDIEPQLLSFEQLCSVLPLLDKYQCHAALRAVLVELRKQLADTDGDAGSQAPQQQLQQSHKLARLFLCCYYLEGEGGKFFADQLLPTAWKLPLPLWRGAQVAPTAQEVEGEQRASESDTESVAVEASPVPFLSALTSTMLATLLEPHKGKLCLLEDLEFLCEWKNIHSKSRFDFLPYLSREGVVPQSLQALEALLPSEQYASLLAEAFRNVQKKQKVPITPEAEGREQARKRLTLRDCTLGQGGEPTSPCRLEVPADGACDTLRFRYSVS